MKNIFGMTKKEKKNTASIAKIRLKEAMMGDKNSLNFDFLPKMEKELLDILDKYVDISNNELRCDISNSDGEGTLDLSIVFQKKDDKKDKTKKKNNKK